MLLHAAATSHVAIFAEHFYSGLRSGCGIFRNPPCAVKARKVRNHTTSITDRPSDAPPRKPPAPSTQLMATINFAQWTPARREVLARMLFAAIKADGVLPHQEDVHFWRSAAQRVNEQTSSERLDGSKSAVSPEWLCAAVFDALALRPTVLLHDGIEELLLGERLRSRHVAKRGPSEVLASPYTKRPAPSSSMPAQMARSQSALQISKLVGDEAAISFDDAPAITVSHAVSLATDVSVVPQMRRSQSALQIPKVDDEEEVQPTHAVLQDASPCADECSPRKSTTASIGSAPATPPVESQMKRSQSALQIPKMGRIGSCGSLVELAGAINAAGGPPLNVA